MGVSKNNGTPKWMVKIMENPMNKWMIWGIFPLFLVQHPFGEDGLIITTTAAGAWVASRFVSKPQLMTPKYPSRELAGFSPGTPHVLLVFLGETLQTKKNGSGTVRGSMLPKSPFSFSFVTC